MGKWASIGAAGLIAAAGLAGAAVAAEKTAADRLTVEWASPQKGYALSPAPDRRSGNDVAVPARRKLVRTSGEPGKRRLRHPMPVLIGAFR